MIAKNEEKFIGQCLDSVKCLVDEIIVVDTGSTDKTKEIALGFGAKVYDFKWCDNFSAARNESLKHATSDWILILDADEVISIEDHSKIKEMLNDTDAAGFLMIQRNYTDKSHAAEWVSTAGDKYKEAKAAAGWFPVPIIRIFRNDKRVGYSGLVHEKPNDSLMEIGKVALLNVPIHHYGKLDADKLKEKGKMYEKIGEEKVKEKKDYYFYFELGKQYTINKKFDKAVEAFEKSIELKNDFFESWYMLGSVYLIKENFDNALSKLKRAQALNHNFGPIYANLGVVYAKKKELKKAAKNFATAVKLNPKDAASYKNLGMCFDELGEKEKAYSCFKKAIELNPTYKDVIKLG